MQEFIGFTISGLVTASIFGLVACGLTLTYTTTGIFNWAQGALVAVGAFTYWQLEVGWGWPRWLAVATCLLIVGPIIGWLLERTIMFRLEGTSEATKMVVTLALLLGVVAGINIVWDPTQLRQVTPLADGRVFTIADQRIPYNDVIVIGLALLTAFALRTLLYRTRTGVEMRATVDDRSLATLNGVSPIRTASRSWMVSTSLAVLAGILISPRSPLTASTLALLIVNTYAAAVIGRLRSLPMTFLGAIILGLSIDYAQGYIGADPSIPGSRYLTGLIHVLPVVILFVALQFLPQAKLRGARTLRVKEVSTPPTWSGSLIFAGSTVLAAIALTPLLAPGDLNSATKVWGFALVALSLVPLVGYAGRLSVCPLAFAAVGAITVAHVGSHGVMAILLAAVVTALVGVLVSLTAIRLSGLYLALATAAFAVMLDGWIYTLPPFRVLGNEFDLFQGGTLAIARFEPLGIDTTSDSAYFIFGSVVFAVAALAVTALRRSDFGLRLIALKDSPVGYATLGLNQRLTTASVFAVSAAIAGVGGAVLGGAIQRPSPAVFTFLSGLGIIVAVVIVGATSIGGAVVAGVFLGAPAISNIFPKISEFGNALIGTAGVGLGQDPRGAIPADIRPAYEPVVRARLIMFGGAAVIVSAYVLALTGVIGNYPFVLTSLATLVAMPVAAARALPRPPRDLRDAVADELSAPPERLGLTEPLTARDMEVLRSA
jgi:branched-chain amino acid transport system permease protein